MKPKQVLRILAYAVGFCLAGPLYANSESDTGAKVRVTGGGDLFAAGGNVEVSDRVPGDAYVAGGRVTLDEMVEGDVFVAGGTVITKGRIEDNLYAAAGTLTVQGEVGRHVRAAGGDVVLAREARIDGKATLAGGHVEIAGTVGKYLTVAGDTVRINGRIAGGAEISARNLEVGPNANIAGKLTYRSPREAKVDPAARLAGGVEYQAWHMPESVSTAGAVALIIGKVFMLIGLMVVGSLLVLIFPNFTGVVEGTIASNPVKSLLLGFALIICLPVLAVFFIVTILGIPLGLTVLCLYPLVLMLGYLTSAAFIGDKGARLLRKGQTLTLASRVVGLTVALILLALLQAVPVIGGITVFVLLLVGLGAWVITLYQRYYVPKASQAS